MQFPGRSPSVGYGHAQSPTICARPGRAEYIESRGLSDAAGRTVHRPPGPTVVHATGINLYAGRGAWPWRPAGEWRVVVAGSGRRPRGAADRGASVAMVGLAPRSPTARRQRALDRVGRPV